MKYREEISALFGVKFLDVFEALINKGAIAKEHIKSTSDEMGVRVEYDQHKNTEGLGPFGILENVLDAWYEKFASKLTDSDAQKKFEDFMRQSRYPALAKEKLKDTFKSKPN